MIDYNIRRVIEFLDKYLTEIGRDHITPVEANRLLVEASLLRDSQQRPGKPLRDLLRGGQLPHAYQSGGKASEWRIPASSSKRRTRSTGIQPEIPGSVWNSQNAPGADLSSFGAGLSAADAIDLRQLLLDVYSSRCPITGCDIAASLEVGLFVPFLGPQTYHIANGILLRADLRVLFELL